MAAKVTIGSAVGRMPALNALNDQTTIIRLLNRIQPAKGGVFRPIPPPQRPGIASPQLIEAIVAFQRLHVEPRFRDGRVDPGGATLARLNAVALNAASGLEIGIAPLEDRIEEETRQHILRAVRAFPADSEHDRLFYGLQKLASERNDKDDNGRPFNCSNRPLAYAEHYLLCRWFVSLGSFQALGGRQVLFLLMSAAVLGYDLVKLLNFIASHLSAWEKIWPGSVRFRRAVMGLILQTGACPMSDNAPDVPSIKWSLRGSTAGLSALVGDPTF